MVQRYSFNGFYKCVLAETDGDLVTYQDYQKLEAELEQLRQQVKAPGDDGWIAWGGGECPVDLKTKVEVRLRNGSGGTSWAWMGRWSHEQVLDDIIAYRIVRN